MILSGKQLTFGSNSLISEAEDAVSSPTHSLIFNQVQSGSTTGSGSGSMGGASGKKAGGTDSVDFPFQFNFGSIYSSSLTIYFDNWASYLNKFSFKNKIMQNNCWTKFGHFRPFFLVMLLLWLKFVFIPILTYVVYLWLWFLAIFDPYLRPPSPMAPLHIFDP